VTSTGVIDGQEVISDMLTADMLLQQDLAAAATDLQQVKVE
jgi:hypothetical protein